MTYAEIDTWLVLAEDAPIGWSLETIQGWKSPAPPKLSLQPRPQAHGSFSPGKTKRGSKVLTVKGSFTGASIDQAEQAMADLANLASDGDSFLIRYQGQTMTVWLATAPDMPDDIWTPYFRFEFDVTAVDPRKYDEVVPDSTGLPMAAGGATWPFAWPVDWGVVGSLGQVEMSNMGGAESVPVFQIAGGLPDGFVLTEVGTDREIRFTGAVPLGSTLFLNPRTGVASLDNQADRSGQLARADWWSVAPGETSTVQFASLGGAIGDPTLTVLFASANW